MAVIAQAPGPWYRSRQFRHITVGALWALLLIEGYYAVFVRENDFVCHVAFGQHFREGNPYASAGNYYPLSRVMLDSLLTFANYRATRAMCYLLALGALWASLRIWQRSAEAMRPAAVADRLPIMALTVAVTLAFLLRDLDECGLQIFLLLLLSLGLVARQAGRPWLCGLSLAAAASYKATPLLFLPFLLWKREWKAAGSMLACTVLLNLAPAAFLGWEPTLRAHQYWFLHTTTIMRNTPEAHPSVPGIELPKHQNESLAAALSRLVESYPPGHPLYVDHPLFFQFGNLPPDQAKATVKGLILLLGALMGWRMLRRWPPGGRDAGLAKEWSVACIFSALLSPLCWKQHLVLILPAIYLIASNLVTSKSKGRWRWMPLAAIAACLLLTRRGIVGRELDHLLMAYNVNTLAVLAAVPLVLRLRAERGENRSTGSEDGEVMAPSNFAAPLSRAA